MLPCCFDPVAIGVMVDGYWALDALSEHVRGCRRCDWVRDLMAAMAGSRGGALEGPESAEVGVSTTEVSEKSDLRKALRSAG
jgi:hypothetical protein